MGLTCWQAVGLCLVYGGGVLWVTAFARACVISASLKRSRQDDADQITNGKGVVHFDAGSNPNEDRDHG